jgi:hypothetical protein
MELEHEYRSRLHQVHNEVKKRLVRKSLSISGGCEARSYLKDGLIDVYYSQQ